MAAKETMAVPSPVRGAVGPLPLPLLPLPPGAWVWDGRDVFPAVG